MAGDQRRLRVLHLTAGSDAGGASRYLFDLCRAMQRAGHEVTIAGARGAWHDLFDGAAFDWLELPLKGGPIALWRSAKVLRRAAAARRWDLIHCHYRKAALVGRRVAGALDLPLLFTLHLTGIPWSWWHRRLTDFGDHTHVPSQAGRRWLIDQGRLPAERITVIPHGVDAEAFPLADAATQRAARAALDVPVDATVAAYVGRFDVPKQVDWMLDLAAAARRQLPGLVVLLAGEGPHEQQLRRRIAAEDLTPQVRMLPYGDPLPVYRCADALLLPSALEGFSLVCLEAMSVGRAVLRTRTAGTDETIIEGVTGKSVAVERGAFIEAAIGFLADRGALATMGAAAADHARRQLSFDRRLEQTMALYRRLIAGAAP